MRCRIDAAREGVRLDGHVSIPSYSRANALQQYVYVNGRPVRDRLIAGAIRGAYADVLARDRHAVAALFLDARSGAGRRQRPSRPRPTSASAIPAWCAG